MSFLFLALNQIEHVRMHCTTVILISVCACKQTMLQYFDCLSLLLLLLLLLLSFHIQTKENWESNPFSIYLSLLSMIVMFRISYSIFRVPFFFLHSSLFKVSSRPSQSRALQSRSMFPKSPEWLKMKNANTNTHRASPKLTRIKDSEIVENDERGTECVLFRYYCIYFCISHKIQRHSSLHTMLRMYLVGWLSI